MSVLTTELRPPCADEPELMHPIGTGQPAVEQALTAIDVCIDCPLMTACRADADQRDAELRHGNPKNGGGLDEIAGGWDYNRSRRAATRRHLQLQVCGTPAGYRMHRAHNEAACDRCAAATTPKAAPTRKARGRRLKPCGTRAAYERHRAHGETPCAACFNALSEHNTTRAAEQKNERHTRRAGAPKTGRPVTEPCGTDAAYRRHLDHGEQPCTPCKQAHTARRTDARRASNYQQKRVSGNTQRVLDTIVRHGTTDPRDLARRLQLDTHKVTRCLRTLQAKGLLEVAS